MPRGCKEKPRTDLERFVREVGATSESVAAATGLSQPTVWRAMTDATKGPPRLRTYLLIKRWADSIAKQKKLPRSRWLRWEFATDAAA